MKRHLIPLMATLAVSGATHAGCTADTPPATPDARRATEFEMLDAQLALNTYLTNNNDYLACLDREGAEASEDEMVAVSAARTAAYSAAVEEMTATTSAFNDAMAKFRGVSR
ncbi:MAG: hypothetical protein IPH83_08985 [Gammaproteobacteria bacterium]|nr:hypothetical protein [Gammaproteobacteria bacterium]MBK9664656.1 hypothetical protein [Gammaproteobacteria bacterium]